MTARQLHRAEPFWPAEEHGPTDPAPWMSRALCKETDPEAFYPEKGSSNRPAKSVCGKCEVRDECLEYALANDERWGIWGGLSEKQRRKLKREVAA
jgi:WhiB family redox-sensing transcriptional regulator